MLENPNKHTIEDIIFEGKNKEYGAYELRKYYSKRLLSALLIAVVIVVVLLLIPKKEPEFTKKYQVKEIVLSPLKKIKETVALEEPAKKKVQETVKKSEEILKEVKQNEVKNETKLEVVENKEKTDINIEEVKNETNTTNNNQAVTNKNNNNSSNNLSNDNNDVVVDGKSAKFPIIFPGCEKYSGDSQKLFICFSNKMRDEVNYYLSNATIKKKSKEEIYFEIDKNGDISNIKLNKGDKINDIIALGTLKKIAQDFNKRTSANKRIKPAKDEAGRNVVVFYKLPISFEDPEID